MEFCPYCKSMMVPQTRGRKIVVACRTCGRKAKKFSPNKYKVTEKVRSTHRDILVVEEERKKSTTEERNYITDLYGNEMYEMGED